MPLRLTVELVEELTWGELIAFVDAARLHVQDADHVEIVNRENETEFVPDLLAVDLPAGAQPARVMDDQDARSFRAALQAVIDNQGDARIVLRELTRLRDALD
jgi:hypothetical protein